MIGKRSLSLKLIFCVIFLSFIIETIVNFFADRDVIILFQTFISLFAVGFFFGVNKVSSNKSIFIYIILISALLFFLGLFSSNIVRSYNFIFKFITPFLYLLVGFSLVKNGFDLISLISKLWLFLLYFVLYVLSANIFNYGESFYEGALISVGYMNINATYVPVVIILVVLFLNKHVPRKFDRNMNLFLSVIVCGIIILMLKRTLILMIILGILFYLFRNFSLVKVVKFSFFLFIFGLLILSNFSDYLRSSFEARQSRFSEDYSLTEEGRFIENFVVYNYFAESPEFILFGTGEVFNDLEYMYDYFRIERNLHNSFIRLIWSSGVIGVLIFLLFYFKQYSLIRYHLKMQYNRNFYSDVFYFGCVLVLLRFVNDFSSGITYISYNILSYLIIGSIIALGYSKTPLEPRSSSKIYL